MDTASQKEYAAALLRSVKQELKALVDIVDAPVASKQVLTRRLQAVEKTLRKLRDLQDQDAL